MKIVHIVASAPYNDNWGYQDNLLPRYQSQLGHDVTVIACNQKHENGKIASTPCGRYRLDDGVEVIRLEKKKIINIYLSRVFSYLPIGDLLKEIMPDYIFSHGLLSCSIFAAIRYKKKDNPDCVIVQDSHLDYYNGQGSTGIKKKLLRTYYRMLNRISQKKIDCIYGVTPWRMQYAEDYFGIHRDKLKLLVMGADNQKIDFAHQDQIRAEIRTELGLSEDDFVVISGGKIDRTKNIHLLMKAVKNLNHERIKLIVFGNVAGDVKEEVETLSGDMHIRNIGWIDAGKVYDYFLASDLAFFPGTHSVLWEQACGCGIPCVFKKWDGMLHVSNGTNAIFMENNSVDAMSSVIWDLFTDREQYCKMKYSAMSFKSEFFYEEIAKKAIDEVS